MCIANKCIISDVMDRDFVYIYSPIFNYLWDLLYYAWGTRLWSASARFRSQRNVHRPTALADSGPFELYEHMWRTCLDSAADRADITPPPNPVSVCTFGCIAHVTYRNWSKILEYDFVVSRA